MLDEDDKPEEEGLDEGLDAENEEGEGGEEGEADKKAGSKKKLIIIIAGVVVLLVAVAAGLFFTGIIGGGGDSEHAEGEDVAGGAHGKKAKGGGHGEEGAEASAFLQIPTMIVNLNTEDGTPRYLRLSVQLELANPADMPAVEAVIPRVVDQFQTYLRELRVKDLRGSSGIYRLQMELLWRVNQAAAPVEIKDVLFQEILIQ